MNSNIIKKLVNEIIDSNDNLIGSDNIPSTGSDLESAGIGTSDSNVFKGHQNYRNNYASILGFSVLEQEKNNDEKVIDEDKIINNDNYKALKFTQSDPNLGDIEMRILPIISQNKVLIEKNHWLPADKNGKRIIKTGKKFFNLSEYNDLIKKFRSLKNVKEIDIDKERYKNESLDEDKISDKKDDDKSINKKKTNNDILDKKIGNIADLLNKKFNKDQLNKLVNLLEIK